MILTVGMMAFRTIGKIEEIHVPFLGSGFPFFNPKRFPNSMAAFASYSRMRLGMMAFRTIGKIESKAIKLRLYKKVSGYLSM